MISIPDADRSTLREELLRFFDANARDLPWRETTDPYRVWVSEIMLQQTRVDTAIPYFLRWMKRFPTVGALADAPLEAVLEAWAGLGYYSRARNLHRAAGVVREEHNGGIPSDLGGLRSLPGIGEYTAGAVASIAFGVAAPAVDGNVRRVLSRVFDIEEPTPSVLRAYASALVDPARPGDFNQSLMELGATVCSPRAPRCEDCPVRGQCLALKRGTVGQRPPVRATKAAPRIDYAVAVIRFDDNGDVWTALRRRPESGLLGGMLEFPSIELPETSTSAEVARGLVLEATGLETETAQPLGPVPHRFSHIAATYRPFVVDIAGSSRINLPTDYIQLAWSGLATAALPTAQRKIAQAAERLEPTWRSV